MTDQARMDGKAVFERNPGEFLPAIWTDSRGVVHSARGDEVHRGIFLMWTACGKHDIPANSALFKQPGDVVTCPHCAQPKP